jgi:transcriptional regulator with XRE-family HTH domain
VATSNPKPLPIHASTHGHGETLAAYRTAIHLSVAEVALACGVSCDTYAMWERGQERPSPAQCKRLARVLRVREPSLMEALYA